MIKLRVLRASRDEALVADAMYFLNHIAKNDSHNRWYIYHLKNKLIKLWYPRHCVNVSAQKQSQECWSCDGTGSYATGNDCWKCGGTGIYRQHVLFRFVFDIAGQKYIWHQPAKSIDWLTAPDERDWEHLTEFIPYETEPVGAIRESPNVEYCYVLVRQYLARNGVNDLMELISISNVLYHFPGRQHYRHWSWKMDRRTKNFKRLWEFAQTGKLPVDDDIPF